MKEDIFSQLKENSSDLPLEEGHRLRFIKKLDHNFHLENRLWNLQRYLTVASVIIFLGISVLVLISIGDYQNSGPVFSSNSTELYETEMYLRAEIDSKLDVLAASQEVDPQVLNDIKKEDRDLKQIHFDLQKNPGDERLISAVLEAYQTKIEILDRIISQIKYYHN